MNKWQVYVVYRCTDGTLMLWHDNRDNRRECIGSVSAFQRRAGKIHDLSTLFYDTYGQAHLQEIVEAMGV